MQTQLLFRRRAPSAMDGVMSEGFRDRNGCLGEHAVARGSNQRVMKILIDADEGVRRGLNGHRRCQLGEVHRFFVGPTLGCQ